MVCQLVMRVMVKYKQEKGVRGAGTKAGQGGPL